MFAGKAATIDDKVGTGIVVQQRVFLDEHPFERGQVIAKCRDTRVTEVRQVLGQLGKPQPVRAIPVVTDRETPVVNRLCRAGWKRPKEIHVVAPAASVVRETRKLRVVASP